MNEKSFEIFSKEHSSGEKFDYFVCSVAGALFAYIGQTYTPHTFDSWFYFLTPVALLLLTLCFCCGFILIHLSNKVTRLNRKVVQGHEQCSSLTELLRSNQPVFTNTLGETANRETLEKKRDDLRAEIERYEKEAYSKMAIADVLGIVRNILLGFGFVLILLSKILQPYLATK